MVILFSFQRSWVILTLFCFIFLSFSHFRSWETREILYSAICFCWGSSEPGINASEPIIVQLIDGPEASYLAKHIIECAQPDVRYHCFLSVLSKEVIIFHMPSSWEWWKNNILGSKQGLLINPLSTMVSLLYVRNPRQDLIITGCWELVVGFQ